MKACCSVSEENQQRMDGTFMGMALEEAQKADRNGEVPVGAVLVKGDRVLARDHNRCIELNDPTAHAEILVLRQAGGVLKNYRLNGTVLYVTAEPCLMCASAMIHSRISRLIYGTREPKSGAVGSRINLFDEPFLNHRISVNHGVLEEACAEQMKTFFKRRRPAKKAVGAESRT